MPRHKKEESKIKSEKNVREETVDKVGAHSINKQFSSGGHIFGLTFKNEGKIRQPNVRTHG